MSYRPSGRRTGQRKIQIINDSRHLKDDEIGAALPAVQTQVHRDFAPVWGLDASLELVEKGRRPDQGAWWITFIDYARHAGGEGNHFLTTSGLPFGRIFVQSTKKVAQAWTSALSHELLELLADPDTNVVASRGTTKKNSVWHAYEVCDPCADDSYGYKIDGVLVSDFVYPAWFESFQKGGVQFDHRRLMTRPFQVLPLGYAVTYRTASKKGAGLSVSLTAPKAACTSAEKRKKPRGEWERRDSTRTT
jgi:hypothetical protein